MKKKWNVKAVVLPMVFEVLETVSDELSKDFS